MGFGDLLRPSTTDCLAGFLAAIHGEDRSTLAADADCSIYDAHARGDTIYVLGNESSGVSAEISKLADTSLVNTDEGVILQDVSVKVLWQE